MDPTPDDWTATFIDRYVEALRARNVNPRCDVCGHESWHPGASLVELPSAHAGVQRMVALACANCATVRLIAPDLIP